VAGFTAFHLATNGAFDGGSQALAIAALLPAYGGDPNLRNRFGQAPLVEAVMSSRVECVLCLIEAGADPDVEDGSSRALADATAAAATAKDSDRAPAAPRVPTPRSMAAHQPALLKVFSRADLCRAAQAADAGSDTFPCANPGCAEAGKKACTRCSRCLRAGYCGGACQSADWARHRPLCRVAAGELTRLKVAYHGPWTPAAATVAGSSGKTSRPLKAGRPHVVKLQLPLTAPGGEAGGEAVRRVLGYDRLRSRVFDITLADNDPAAFAALVKAVREGGVSGGLKAYANCWAADGDHSERGGDVDVDLRCLRPALPW
jgi:hypothetical protein